MPLGRTEVIGLGILGGVLGAGVLVGAAGMAYHHHMMGGMRLPLTLEVQTNASTPSTMHIFATVCHHRMGKKNMATLTIHPFKAAAVGAFSAVGAVPVLPISFVPISNAAPVNVDMYAADGKTLVKGTLAIGANGSIVLTGPNQTADKDAWGLAKTARIHYEVAKM